MSKQPIHPRTIASWLRRLTGGQADPGRAELTDDQPGSLEFVICGDILSCTGYAKSARALARMLSEHGRVLGTPLQIDPNDCGQPFPGNLIDREQLFARSCQRQMVVIHHATPEHYFHVPRATNIGYFYWETRSLPRQLHWPERLGLMDAVWAPTQFIADFAREAGFAGPVDIVPWVQDFTGNPSGREALPDVHLIPLMPEPDDDLVTETVSYHAARNRHDFAALAVQSLAPRKGLQLLLAEWRDFLAAHPANDAILILKLNFIHAHGIAGMPMDHFRRLLRRYGFAPGDRTGIGLINARISDGQMHDLQRHVDVYCTASLGEGFGGPVVEALQAGTPVIAARHTGIADLLPESSALCVPCHELLIGLRDNIEVYPHSSYWHVIDRGEMAQRFAHLAAATDAERNALMIEQRQHAERFCAPNSVRQKLVAALYNLGLAAA